MRRTRRYTKMLASIRYRIVLVYVLLIFIAMTLLGALILQQLESYHMDTVRINFDTIVRNSSLLETLNGYDNLHDHQSEIQMKIEEWNKGAQQEIFVVDDNFKIIAASNTPQIDKNAVDILDENVIVCGLAGEESEQDGYLTTNGIPVKSKVYPFQTQDGHDGVLYLRADLTNIYKTVNKTKIIFVQAMIVSIIVTGLLGFLIAGSITVPINVLRRKAENMARGDFTQIAEVKSDDEIGRLTEMFNLMQRRLGNTMSEMLNEKNKLETILKYMADGLIAVDLQGNIIHVNDTAIQMLNLSREKLGYMSYYDIMMEKYCEELTLRSIKEKSEKLEGDAVFQYGSSIFNARYGKFEDEKNRDKGIIIVIQNITERQKLERMQQDFVANVSHELKTPLTTIKSYIETILETLIEDEKVSDTVTVKEFLHVVDKEAERMSRLVKDLLQLSRFDYNKEILNKRRWDMTALVEDALSKIEINAKNKEQHLNNIYDPQQEVYTYVDKDRTEQVLINILSNAIKYTSEKGRIDVDIQERAEDVLVLVSDNGIGIPVDDIPRLFERFYRVDKARSRQMGGTGLGLAIAKQIIEAHGGSIAVESREGKGTKITMIFPKGNPE